METVIQLIRNWAFGPFAALAFLVALFVFWKKGREEYIDQYVLIDLALYTVIWGWLGARLGFILVHFSGFGWDFLRWFSLLEYPGYLGLAGAVCAAFGLWLGSRRAKVELWKMLDIAGIAGSLGLVVLYLGMFMHGAGFGTPTTLPWGLPFPGVFDRRHPVQLYAVPCYLLLFVVLRWLGKHYRLLNWYRGNKRIAQPGLVTAVFWVGFGLIELGLSFFRSSDLELMHIPVEQIVYMVYILGGILIFFSRWGVLSFSSHWKQKKATT